MDRVSVFIVGLCLAGMVSGENVTISAVIGEDVILPCEAKEHLPFELVEWSRPTGGNPDYILVFRHNKIDPNQTPKRYHGRAELQEPQNGDASLDLKNVTTKDKGTYECYVLKESNRRKRSIDPISIVYLNVTTPSHVVTTHAPHVVHTHAPHVVHTHAPHVPPSDGVNIGLIVGLLVALIAVAAVVAAFVLNKKKQKSSHILHIPRSDVVRELIKK